MCVCACVVLHCIVCVCVVLHCIMCVCACVCVRVRSFTLYCVCVCVCVCSFTLYYSSVCVLSAATECAGLKSCKDCLTNSKCGWCNGMDNKGLGRCMDGRMRGPYQRPADPSASLGSVGQQQQCPADRWFFTKCPCKWGLGQSCWCLLPAIKNQIGCVWTAL